MSALNALVGFFISMPRSKKKAHELTADEVMKKIFTPKVLRHIKKIIKKRAKK